MGAKNHSIRRYYKFFSQLFKEAKNHSIRIIKVLQIFFSTVASTSLNGIMVNDYLCKDIG